MFRKVAILVWMYFALAARCYLCWVSNLKDPIEINCSEKRQSLPLATYRLTLSYICFISETIKQLYLIYDLSIFQMMSLTMPFVSFHRKQIHLTWNGWSFTAYSTALVDFSTAFYIALKTIEYWMKMVFRTERLHDASFWSFCCQKRQKNNVT